MKNKQIIIIFLCLGLVFSSLGDLPSIFAKEGTNILDLFYKSSDDASIQIPVTQKVPMKELKAENESFEAVILQDQVTGYSLLNEGSASRKGLADSNQLGGLSSIPETSSTEVEQYFKEGFSIKDIVVADNLSKKHDKKTKDILHEKKDKTQTFDQLDKQYSKVRIDTFFNNLKSKYPSQYEQLRNAGLQEDQQVEVLALYSNYEDINLKEFINKYKKNGKKEIENVVKTNKINKKPTKLNKYHLTQAEGQMYSDDTLDRYEKIATAQNITVKEYIKQLNDLVEQMKKKPSGN